MGRLVILLWIASFTSLSAAQEIAVGVIAPLTGVRSDAGEYIRSALAIARDEIQADPSRPLKFRFIIEDSRYEPQNAVTAIHKLIEIDKARFIIGAYGSAETLAVAPIAERSSTILISPGSQAAEISQAGDYIFRLMHNVAYEAPWFARFIAPRLRNGRIDFLTISTGIGPSYLNYFRPALEQHGGELGIVGEFSASDTDFRSHLLRLKAAGAADLFLMSTPAQLPLILRQSSQLGFRPQFYNIGVEGQEIVKQTPELAAGLLYPYSYDSEAGEPAVVTFHQEYLDRFKVIPDAVAANSYDAAQLLNRCANERGPEPSKVRDCLYAVRDYHGASGTFSIDSSGDAQRQLFVKTIRHGRFVRY
jgi:branched-chain amino acid transport system substrate-binding protein